MQSTDTTLQSQQVMSPTAGSGCSLVNQQVMDQFIQMRTMLSSFLGQKQETTTCAAFCNYLVSEVEGLEEKDFQTFRNEAAKLLSNIQSKAEEHGRQPQQPQTLSMLHFSSAASTATAASSSSKGIHLNHPRDTSAFKPGRPTCSAEQQQSRGQPTAFIVVDDQQQTGPSRPLTFTLTLTMHFNPPSVASATGEEIQRNISGLSSFFGNLQSVMSYQQIDTPQPFSRTPAASPPTTTAAQQEHHQPSLYLSPQSVNTKHQSQ